ncbi:unnamed protein product [Chrysoparadoxa australica]
MLPITPSVDPLAGRLLGLYLAFCCLWFMKEYAVLEVAYLTMWKPYLSRIKKAIAEQYCLFILTELATSESISFHNQVALLQLTSVSWEGMSMYAIAQAMNFVPDGKVLEAVLE